jgi:hypothetical protein
LSSVASYLASLFASFLTYDSALNMAATAGKTSASPNGVVTHHKSRHCDPSLLHSRIEAGNVKHDWSVCQVASGLTARSLDRHLDEMVRLSRWLLERGIFAVGYELNTILFGW